MLDDASLLVAYTVKRDASAFRRLLEGHIDFVYAAALRQTSDPHLADDITQAVFLLLSQKARSLKPGILLKGWLFNATRYAAANALRAQQRRKIHEQEAAAMRPSTVAGFSPSPFSSDASVPDQAQSHFDAALASLSESDRNALLVRFFEDQPFSCVGQRLGISEYAAQKRVSRALDRVRRYLLRKDIAADSLTVPGLLILCAGQSAPSHLLSAAFTAIEGAAQGAVSSSTVSIAKGASKMLMRSHAKLVALKTTVLLASGSVALAVAVEAPRLSSPAAPPPANPRVILADQAPTADSDTQLVYEACRQCMLSIMDAHDHNDLKAILDLCYFSPQMDPRMVEMIKFEIQDDLVRYHLRKVAFDHFGGRAQLLNVHGEGVVNILNDVLARCTPSVAHMTGH